MQDLRNNPDKPQFNQFLPGISTSPQNLIKIRSQLFLDILYTDRQTDRQTDRIRQSLRRSNKKAVLSQGNRAMPQQFFSV